MSIPGSRTGCDAPRAREGTAGSRANDFPTEHRQQRRKCPCASPDLERDLLTHGDTGKTAAGFRQLTKKSEGQSQSCVQEAHPQKVLKEKQINRYFIGLLKPRSQERPQTVVPFI